MTTLTSRSGQLYVTIEGREYPTLKEQEHLWNVVAYNEYYPAPFELLDKKLLTGIQIPDELVELKPKHRLSLTNLTMVAVLKSQDQKKEVRAEIDYKAKYEKCISIIKKFDPGIIGMYDL